MTPDEIKAFLQQAKEDPALIKRDTDELDDILLGVIKLEKKHLYGTGTTSANRRREQIEKYLDDALQDFVEGE